MTAPGGATPPGSLGVGLFRAMQMKTVDEAKATMSGGIMSAFEGLQDTAHDEYNTPISERPKIVDVPINSTLWTSMDPKEQATFARSQLTNGAASSTSTGGSSTASPHVHNMSQIPQYVPAGSGFNGLEIGFIRITKDCKLDMAGFCSGGSLTWLGINAAYLGVYRMNPANGNLTLLAPAAAAIDIKSNITATNTEHRFSLGVTIDAHQDEVYAVATLQVTGFGQNCASLLATTITDMNRANSSLYPRKNYAYANSYSSMPATIAESDLHWDHSTKLPFYYLRAA
ncbi:hypothetical protein [Nocardia concava]|uniref:hypothetical protein n=1 Tax=Nocardia concava TaxID=257281 RepID=UPI000301AABA|nr:hypothetical protein [Nocardia concava]